MPSLEDLTSEQQAQAIRLFEFVQGNPDVAKDIRRAAKAKNPSMNAPDLDLEDRLEAQRKEFDEKLAADRKERLDALQAQRRTEAHQRIKDCGLSPDEVEKVMVDENIGNYDTAIKYVRAQKALAPATPESITPMTMPDTKELWADKIKFARSEAFAAVNELKAQRRTG
jgi:hypothetical protein